MFASDKNSKKRESWLREKLERGRRFELFGYGS